MAGWILLVSVAVGIAGHFLQPAAVSEGYGLLDRSALSVHEGDLAVTTDGAIVENLEIRGSLFITGAKGVTVRNVWVYTSGPWSILVDGGGDATFEHVEIGHPRHVGERGIGGDNVTARFLDIHHVEDGIKLGTDSSYSNVHVHDLDSLSPSPHADAVQADGGISRASVTDSILDSTGPLGLGNAAVLLGADLGPIDDVVFRGNVLNGGNYVIFVDAGSYGAPTQVRFVDNAVGRDFRYGVAALDGPVEWEGNIWADTGDLVELGAAVVPTVPDVSTTSTTAIAEPITTTTITVQTTSSVRDDVVTAEAAEAEPAVRSFWPGDWTALLLGFVMGVGAALIAVIPFRSTRRRRHRSQGSGGAAAGSGYAPCVVG